MKKDKRLYFIHRKKQSLLADMLLLWQIVLLIKTVFHKRSIFFLCVKYELELTEKL